MAKQKPASGSAQKSRPAITPEARINKLISETFDLVEERIRDKTATSQETTTILKMGSLKYQLELEKLRKETELITEKKVSLEESRKIQTLYEDALAAFKRYSGNTGAEDELV